ncbi:MAG: hypothetical protein M1830_003948 [Pleopsidium flavum]|nr:MAG: hypothetical protein M1830_003948 [Pleopsidium flavum]
MAPTVAEQPQATEVSSKKHAACDECRGRKLKCSGDSPQCSRCLSHNLVCHYSFQKPMGRPKKRRCSSLGENQEVPGIDIGLTNGVSDPWNLIGDPMTLSNNYGDITLGPVTGVSAVHSFIQPRDEEMSIQAPRQIADIDFSDWQPPDFPNHTFLNGSPVNDYEVEEHSNSPAQPITEPSTLSNAACTCLANLYSTLSSFQSLPPPFFPSSLPPLRIAMNTARAAVQCPHCPSSYVTALQNIMLLGTLFPLIINEYSKLLQHVDKEASKEGPKMFQIGEPFLENAHLHTGNADCPMRIEIELAPDDWRKMARKVIKRDILGKEDGSEVGMIGLVQDMEKRQQTWHEKCQNANRVGCEDTESDGRQVEGQHLCLKIIGLARVGIKSLDLDPDGRAVVAPVADTSAETQAVLENAAPPKQKVQFSDNWDRWPFSGPTF